MRERIVNRLVEYGRVARSPYLLVGDLGYSVVEAFAREQPKRFVNVGVAEQNMAGIAAGIASEGHRVVTYSIGNFNTFRCAEQIRNDIDYHKLSVCTMSVGGGLAYGNMGYSHHAIQDYALMRSFPNTLIGAPADANEAEYIIDFWMGAGGPFYLRLHKNGERCLGKIESELAPGRTRVIRNENSRVAVISTGFATQIALNKREYDGYDILTMPIWGDSCREHVKEVVDSYEKVVVVEDHVLSGGFGSWILESLSGSGLVNKIRLVCLLSSVCGEVGKEDFLLNSYLKMR